MVTYMYTVQRLDSVVVIYDPSKYAQSGKLERMTHNLN